MSCETLGIAAAGLIVWVVISILFGYWAGNIAEQKGFSFGGFFTLGFFFLFIGVIVAACLDDKLMPRPTLNQQVVNDAPKNKQVSVAKKNKHYYG